MTKIFKKFWKPRSHEGIYNAVKSTKEHEEKKGKDKFKASLYAWKQPLFSDSYQFHNKPPNYSVLIRKPSYGAYAPSAARDAMRLAEGLKAYY